MDAEVSILRAEIAERKANATDRDTIIRGQAQVIEGMSAIVLAAASITDRATAAEGWRTEWMRELETVTDGNRCMMQELSKRRRPGIGAMVRRAVIAVRNRLWAAGKGEDK